MEEELVSLQIILIPTYIKLYGRSQQSLDYRLLSVVYGLYALYFYIDDCCTVFEFAENSAIDFDADWVNSINKQTRSTNMNQKVMCRGKTEKETK